MKTGKIKRALISVYDKTGIVDFARALVEEFGIEIISTGGTAALLKEHDIPVTLVEQITGFPEMMDGRVKTLHPKIHAAILADRDNSEHMRQLKEQGIEPIDMVVVNLYPFEETIGDPDCTFEQAIEMIDIGGPCLLRAGAKNHRHVLVVTRPDGYELLLSGLRNGDLDWDDVLAAGGLSAFLTTTHYDAQIASWMSLNDYDGLPDYRLLSFWNWGRLRYGENPHQEAELLECIGDEDGDFNLTTADAMGESDQQERTSFNNYADANAALQLCHELHRARSMPDARCCVFIKHANACGVGIADNPIEAYQRAYLGDPNAAMGGIVACNFAITRDVADMVMSTYQRWGKAAGAGGFFVEVWIAPAFEDDAVELIRNAKAWGERVRLLYVDRMDVAPDESILEYKSIAGGMLAQTRDLIGLNEDQWKVVTKRAPAEAELADLRLAWLICKHTKSNAITVCKDGMLIGNGAGQMSRVMSCRIATWLAKDNGHEEKLRGAVAASDAFFPFPDGPNILMDAGVTAIIQPGGSKRDADSVAACDERGVAMIFTGTRHFKH